MQTLRIHICRPLAGVSAKMTLDSCCLGQPCFLQPKGTLSISRKTIWTEPWSSIKEIRRSVLVFRSLEGRAIIPKVYQSPEAQLPSPTAPRNYPNKRESFPESGRHRAWLSGPSCDPGTPSPSYPALPRRHRRSSPSGARPALKRRLPLHSCGVPSHEHPAPGSGLSARAAIPTAAVSASLGAPQAAAPPPATPSPPPTRPAAPPHPHPCSPPRAGHAPACPSPCALRDSRAPAPISRVRIFQ